MNVKLTLKELILVLIIMPAFVLSLFMMVDMVIFDYNLYMEESTCVRELVRSGVERINIATDNGKCWIETNGYHNGYGE